MRNVLWSVITVVVALLGFVAGYGVSSNTGVEPGYFEAPEAGSYGASSEGADTEGISDKYQEYYKGLAQEQ